MFQKMLAESLYKKYDLNEAFTNGTLAEFNPEDLMNKVMTTGRSMNTIRTFKDKTYHITIFYSDWFGPKGIDDPNTKYWVDVVEEDKDGNQERIYLTSFEDKDMPSDEIVDLLNNWKNEVLTSKRQNESYKKRK